MNEHTEALVSWHEERHEVLNDHANDLAMQGFNKVAGENRVAANMHKSTAARLRELAAAEQQLTTATALLGECEPFVACAGTTNLLTRIREATKGKT